MQCFKKFSAFTLYYILNSAFAHATSLPHTLSSTRHHFRPSPSLIITSDPPFAEFLDPPVNGGEQAKGQSVPGHRCSRQKLRNPSAGASEKHCRRTNVTICESAAKELVSLAAHMPNLPDTDAGTLALRMFKLFFD